MASSAPSGCSCARAWRICCRYREVSLQANSRYLDALAVVDDPTPRQAGAAAPDHRQDGCCGRSCPGFNPLAHATLFKSLMAGEHCLHGFTNRDSRARLTSTQLPRSCADDPKQTSAKVGRRSRRLHAHGLVAKTPRTRRWRMTHYGRNAIGTSLYLREHQFPNAYSGVVH